MAETIEAAVARVDATLIAVQERMAEHFAITKESRAEVKASLDAINATLKEPHKSVRRMGGRSQDDNGGGRRPRSSLFDHRRLGGIFSPRLEIARGRPR